MSQDGSVVMEEEELVTTLFEGRLSESSEESPMEQWSSLVLDAPPTDTPKVQIHIEIEKLVFYNLVLL